ncbi:MAG: PQQ-binding-like beta-propeller repeat protein, partial [Gemmataceae bacterium]
KQAPNTPTPIVAGDHLYVVSDQGFLSCFEPKTGKLLWSERLAGRAYSASPILANGLLYITSEEGIGQVIKPDAEKLNEVTKSDLKEKTFATFVPVDGTLFVRTETLLYRFDAK